MKFALIAAIAMLAAPTTAAIANAMPNDPPGCLSDPIFGLRPHTRTVCDGPIHPDGSWTRTRYLNHDEYDTDTCDGTYYGAGRSGRNCPAGTSPDVFDPEYHDKDTYVVTPDTIPPGEPGHVDQ